MNRLNQLAARIESFAIRPAVLPVTIEEWLGISFDVVDQVPSAVTTPHPSELQYENQVGVFEGVAIVVYEANKIADLFKQAIPE